MRLLFVSALLPDDDPASGFEIANRAIIRALEASGVELVFLGYSRPGRTSVAANEISLGEAVIENARVGRWRKLRWLCRALAKGMPVCAAKLAAVSQAELRERIAAAGPVDGIILNSVQMPTAFPFLAKDMPAIYVAHNVEHVSALQNATYAKGWLRYLYRREARLLKKSEFALCRAASVVMTLSEADARTLGIAPAKAVPLALSIGRTPREDDGKRSHDIGMIGTWSWAPNRVGLDWFVREVAPLLPADCSVAIAGAFDGPPPAASGNVRFLGRVPDAQAFVRASRVIALATKGGTGVQLKTIETFEEGLPCVATASALRGVPETPQNCRRADAPDAFARALVELVEAERSGKALRSDGRDFAERQRAAMQEAMQAGLRRFGQQPFGAWSPSSPVSSRPDGCIAAENVGALR